MQRVARICLSLGIVTASGLAHGQSFPLDTAAYNGGPVLSPNIVCLLWSNPADPFSSTERTEIQDYVVAVQSYLSNWTVPPGSNGAGTEPVPRQYGVWGAYFNGSCQDRHESLPSGVTQLNTQDLSPGGVIGQEVQSVLGSNIYSTPNTIVLMFTKGWPYAPGNPPGFNSLPIAVIHGENQSDWGYASHEIIEAATSSWATQQDVSDASQCDASNNGVRIGAQLCDDAGGTTGVTLQIPLASGYGSPSNSFEITDSIDNIDGFGPVVPCGPYNSNSCAPVGNLNQCPWPQSPAVQPLVSGNAFTTGTTTPPVTVVEAGGKVNVIARNQVSNGSGGMTPGIIHLVASTGGGPFTQVSPPVGWVTETPAVISPDGTSLQMFGRGSDGALYQWNYNGSSWSGPYGWGGYMNGSPAAGYATINGTASTVVMMLATTGQIAAIVNGSWSFISMPANVLAMSPPQIFKRSSTCLDVYFTGMNGQLYQQKCWTPAGSWTAMSSYGFGLVNEVVGDANNFTVLSNTLPQLGGSYRLVNQYSGNTDETPWGYSNSPIYSAGTQAGVQFSGGGTMTFFAQTGGYAYTLYMSTDLFSAGTVTRLDALPVTSPPVAFSPDGVAAWVFARSKQFNGVNNELVYWYFNGSSWSAVGDAGAWIM